MVGPWGGEEIWEWVVLGVRGRTVANANLKNSRDRRVVRERSLPGSLPQHLFARGPNLLRGCEEMKRSVNGGWLLYLALPLHFFAASQCEGPAAAISNLENPRADFWLPANKKRCISTP